MTKTAISLSKHIKYATEDVAVLEGIQQYVPPSSKKSTWRRKKFNVKSPLSESGTGSVMALSERWKKNYFDRFQSPQGPGSLSQPQPSYCSHHHSKHATLLCRYISSSVQPPTPNRTSWDLLEYNARTRSGPNQWSKRGSYIIEEKWYCFSGKPQHCRNTHQLQSSTQNTGLRNFSSNKDRCEGVATGHVVC